MLRDKECAKTVGEGYFRKSRSVGRFNTRAVVFRVAWLAAWACEKSVATEAISAPARLFSCWLRLN